MRNCAGRGAFFRAARAYFINHRAFFEPLAVAAPERRAFRARLTYPGSLYRDKVIGTWYRVEVSMPVADIGKAVGLFH